MKKIDTHQHLLYPDKFGYAWTKDFPALRSRFTLEGYHESAQTCDIEKTLFMEVDVDPGHHKEEFHFFAGLSKNRDSKIAGVIAKCLPESSDFIKEIESIRSPVLKGIRRVLHTQAEALSQSAIFRKNVAALAQYDLSFDLCVTQQQLTVGLELVQACPEVSFILDHCGVPSIAEHDSCSNESWQQWLSGIKALAGQENLACKLSGIPTYATPEQRNPDGLRPYFTEILEAFGPERIVWGGDWPVCNLADGLKEWSELTEQLLGELTADEQQAILIKNAERIYRI